VNKKKRTGLVVIVLLVVFLFAVPVQAAEEKENSLELFKEVFQHVLDRYIHEFDAKTLEEMAIRGLMQQLDPYSRYLTMEYFEDFYDEMEGRFGGVGLSIERIGDYITVVAPFSGTPGEAAGILAGDIIIKVDDTDVVGMHLQSAVNIIRGEPGTSVKLTVLREGVEEPIVFNVVRAVIELRIIESRMLEGQIGYIQLTSFANFSNVLYTVALNELLEEGAKGIILDLRNNPGGHLRATLAIANSFLAEGDSIVHIESRSAGNNTHYASFRALDMPLVVLVNGGSASGSEIVAGAVQDHGVGTLVGTRTFGKATVQHVYMLSNGGAVIMTTAQYFTPDLRQINGVGIEPDVVIEDAAEQLQAAIDIIKEKLN
jgi:carboxyl-terminal processing protease